MRRLRSILADSGPVVVLAAIAAVGSFRHISALAAKYGQTGWQSWAVAVCIDLMCVMAAREIQRDKRTGRNRRGWISWPSLVLAGGIVLTLAANLAEAHPSAWGWIVAATPAGAFLIAMSMLERRASHTPPTPVAPVMGGLVTDHCSAAGAHVTVETTPRPERHDELPAPERMPAQLAPSPAPALPTVPAAVLDDARFLADEHERRHGAPISAEELQRRLRISPDLASDLLLHITPANPLIT
ncbi:DUF2637 domain-containing protein [Acrocarpospora catenulata]|uniref:DUF2637 domain-containing protein n=1 Tax=Acrocarpospora catenulata TaxID=2836182 RepID=UPI001BDA72F7|nr:DUF2637 domain-containing protein [Acrocarpospora catenulata]